MLFLSYKYRKYCWLHVHTYAFISYLFAIYIYSLASIDVFI
jgi:hypothetical protein